MRFTRTKTFRIGLVLAVLIAGIAGYWFLQKRLRNRPDELLTYKQFDSGSDLRLHVYGHDAGAKIRRPVIVFFFGGGWVRGNASEFYAPCRLFADMGFVAISAEYRTQSSHGTTPRESVLDARSAIRWIREHADELRINPSQVIAGGSSAGGHIAVTAASLKMMDEPGENLAISARPDALILISPPLDNSPEGYGNDRFGKDWQTLSPVHLVNADLPPTLILIGDQDELIPLKIIENYRRQMREHAVRCEVEIYPNQRHGGLLAMQYAAAMKRMFIFIESLGYSTPN